MNALLLAVATALAAVPRVFNAQTPSQGHLPSATHRCANCGGHYEGLQTAW